MKKTQKIKVAFMIPGLGRIRRGAESFPVLLAERLSGEYEVKIFSIEKNHELAQTSWAVRRDSRLLVWIFNRFSFFHQILGRYFSYWPAEIECFTFALALLPRLLIEKVDVFVPMSIWGVMIARLVRFINGTKFIYLNHGGAENFILKQKPDFFVVWAPDLLRFARKEYPEVKTVVMPIGIDLSRFSSETKPAKLALERPIFICVAALTPYKRIDLTIKAVSKLRKGSLLLLGEGELKEELERLGKRLLGPKRFLHTTAYYEQISHYYASADVFTLASTGGEALAAVYLEAMASNLPVVGPKDERREYIVGKAGILCDVENVDEYTRALEKATAGHFSNLPLKQVEKFNMDKVVCQYRHLIQSLF